MNRILIPSKTFLLGEYLAVVGGPAVLLSTKPSFEICYSDFPEACLKEESPHKIEFKNTELISEKVYRLKNQPYYWKSPSALLLSSLEIEQKSKKIFSFVDPHKKKGGFGASGAKFLSSYWSYLSLEKKEMLKSGNKESINKLLNLYKSYIVSEPKPSGYDLVSQLKGGITFFQDKEFELSGTQGWPFEDYNFCIVRTGKKVSTHDSLIGHQDLPIKEMTSVVIKAKKAFGFSDSTTNILELIEAINAYRNILSELSLVTSWTSEILTKVKKSELFEAYKGCGAMGGDTWLGIFKNENLSNIKKFLNNTFDRTDMLTSSDLMSGIQESEMKVSEFCQI